MAFFNAMAEQFDEITVCGKPALFTNIRLDRNTIPDCLYAYDVRHDDDCLGIPCVIALYVMVNHWAPSSLQSLWSCPMMVVGTLMRKTTGTTPRLMEQRRIRSRAPQ